MSHAATSRQQAAFRAVQEVLEHERDVRGLGVHEPAGDVRILGPTKLWGCCAIPLFCDRWTFGSQVSLKVVINGM